MNKICKNDSKQKSITSYLMYYFKRLGTRLIPYACYYQIYTFNQVSKALVTDSERC